MIVKRPELHLRKVAHSCKKTTSKFTSAAHYFGAYLRIKAMFQRHNVAVGILDQLPHDLQLSVLKSLVLQDLFDGHHFVGFHHLGFKDDPKGPVANNPFGGITDVLLRL